MVACNDLYDDWKSGNAFKCYSSTDSKSCSSYHKDSCGSACSNACKIQYQNCQNVYVKTCSNNRRSYFHKRAVDMAKDKRFDIGDLSSWLSGLDLNSLISSVLGGTSLGVTTTDTSTQAQNKCSIQYQDCLSENANVNTGNICQTWGGLGW